MAVGAGKPQFLAVGQGGGGQGAEGPKPLTGSGVGVFRGGA